jgi:hypothetical protein
MTVGALTVYLAYLTKFFQPVRDLASDDQRHRPSVGGL